MSELGSLGIAEENKEQNRYRRQTVIYTIPKMTRAPPLQPQKSTRDPCVFQIGITQHI